MKNRLFILKLLGITIFIGWSFFYIYRTSFIGLDGNRYFSLFDDAMISMRYAWNLSHGIGLVWNPGEYVEGYTNLLMTLVMAVATGLFDKITAVLVIQVLGIPTTLAVAFLTHKISRHLYPENLLVADLAFAGILLYFPLSFWSLMGMESGLLTLWLLGGFLCAITWRAQHQPKYLWLSAIFLSLAFLTRNDGLIFSPLIFAPILYEWYSKKDKAELKSILAAATLLGMVIIGQEVFRFWYYGELLPNTYTLKVTGVPILVKAQWGIKFITPFLLQSMLILILSTLEIIRQRFKNIVLVLFIVMAVLYQTWAGGDAWREWRIMLPGMPFLFILAAAFSVATGKWISNRWGAKSTTLTVSVAIVLVMVNVVVLDIPFKKYFDTSQQDIQATYNSHNTNVAIGLQNLTTNNATIGVIWAGVIPYYSGRKAFDFLGKSDKYIAHLPAHLYFPIPGHNKFDLAFSIRNLQPTYIQNFEWAKENLKPWAITHYTRLNYATAYGDITLILKHDDPAVKWDKGTIIPWPEENSP